MKLQMQDSVLAGPCCMEQGAEIIALKQDERREIDFEQEIETEQDSMNSDPEMLPLLQHGCLAAHSLHFLHLCSAANVCTLCSEVGRLLIESSH